MAPTGLWRNVAGIRTEHAHYTPEQVASHLADSKALLTEHGFDPLTHEALLVAVFQKFAEKAITLEQVQPMPPLMGIPRGV